MRTNAEVGASALAEQAGFAERRRLPQRPRPCATAHGLRKASGVPVALAPRLLAQLGPRQRLDGCGENGDAAIANLRFDSAEHTWQNIAHRLGSP